MSAATRSADHAFALGLARAFAGAVIFGLPLLMTMEMWWLGFYMAPSRLALLLVVAIPLLVGLSAISGFERTLDLKEDALDAFVAYAVGFACAAAVLSLLGIIGPGQSLGEIVGKVSLQAVPGSIGALLAQSQLGGEDSDDERAHDGGYGQELFVMATGALFLAFNIAPTEEVSLIADRMTPWHALALIAASLALMHAFVYAVEFHGQASIPEGTPQWSVFLRYTIVGYAIVLLMCTYILWTFGRLDATGAQHALSQALVLGFPGAIGASAARLLL
jgi:putative integral membrane protein (TIGR02587 family)